MGLRVWHLPLNPKPDLEFGAWVLGLGVQGLELCRSRVTLHSEA